MFKIEYGWNPVYRMVMEIKDIYIKRFGSLDTYNLEEMIEKLNEQKYNDFMECLQTTQFNEFVLIRYGLAEMQAGMWEDSNSIYRECRSIVLDMKRDEIVLCPFRKFFNLNEVEENMIDKVTKEIAEAEVFECADKLDGSMQNARWYYGVLFMSGSQALDPLQSWRLADGYTKITDNHLKMISQNSAYTFIFEYISKRDAHVVNYEKKDEGLHLLGMRNVYTGTELNYFEVEEYANKYDVPMAQLENLTFEEMLEKMKEYKSSEKEGWVINIDGHRIKLKCDDYVQLHRMLDKISSINVIIKNVADNTYDDLYSKIPEAHRYRVQEVANKLFEYLRNTNVTIDNYFSQIPQGDRKEAMIWIDTNVPKKLRGFVRSKYLGKEYNLLKNKIGYKKISELEITIEEEE